jgi:hypothetical protein
LRKLLRKSGKLGPVEGETDIEWSKEIYDNLVAQVEKMKNRVNKDDPEEVAKLENLIDRRELAKYAYDHFTAIEQAKKAVDYSKQVEAVLKMPDMTLDEDTGNIINTKTGNMWDPTGKTLLRRGPPVPPTVETEYEKEVRREKEVASTEQEMENVDPQFVPLEDMDTTAPVPAPPAQTFDFFGRERATPAREPTLGEIADAEQERLVKMGEDIGISTRDMTSFLKGAEQREKQAIQAGKQDALSNAQKDAVPSTNVTTSDMQARKQARDAKRDARQQRRTDAERMANVQELMRRSTEALPPVPAPQPTYNDTALTTEEEAIEREDMAAEDVRLPAPAPVDVDIASLSLGDAGSAPSPRSTRMAGPSGMREGLRQARAGEGASVQELLRRSRPAPAPAPSPRRAMGQRVAQAVQAIEGRTAPAPADQEEEKEETDVQETKTADDEDVPMPAVRQEYGQRASIRIAGARGAFNRNFSSYDRVPMESKYPGLRVTDIDVRRVTPYDGFQPLRPLRAQVLAHQKDFSKHRLEKRARATLALLEDTQPRQRARNINTNITPQQVSSVQDDMGRFRRAERMTREGHDRWNERRVDRYNTQPAITVSAEPVVPAEPVATVELDGGGDEL